MNVMMKFQKGYHCHYLKLVNDYCFDDNYCCCYYYSMDCLCYVDGGDYDVSYADAVGDSVVVVVVVVLEVKDEKDVIQETKMQEVE